jgi:hypothetical protein
LSHKAVKIEPIQWEGSERVGSLEKYGKRWEKGVKKRKPAWECGAGPVVRGKSEAKRGLNYSVQ